MNSLTSLPDHIQSGIKVCPDTGCWLWQKSKSRDGYGWTSLNHKTHQAHRLVYKLLCGEPLPGLVCDHLCSVRHCVNPAHIELVTPGENIRRSPVTPAGQDRCTKCGGEFQLIGKAKPQRRCKACAAVKRREYREANKERLAAKQHEWNDANRHKIQESQRRYDAKRRPRVEA